MESNQVQHEVDSIRSDVIELIAKHRLLRLIDGGRFLKYTPKGQRVKDKFWICKLSPNHRAIHYGDLEDNREPLFDELPNRINISDIKRIIIGKDCPHTKEMKKSVVDLAFSLVYESDHEDHLNFVAIDHKTYCHWNDGLNTLLKSQMSSEEFHKDMQTLSRIELKMRGMNK